MADDKLIKKWLSDGTISKVQAQKMLSDLKSDSKEKSSNNFIIALSTIGALLLGIGAMLFIAANWHEMSNPFKTVLLLALTFGSYYLGYLFKYQKKNLPRVGASLLFLGALLFGVTIFLIAQMYNLQANNHILVLIWIIGVLPLAYAFESVPIAWLSAGLFFLWIGLFIFRGMEFGDARHDISLFPVLYIISGIMLFAIGSLHKSSERLKEIGAAYRLQGLKVGLFSIFLLTFNWFSESMIRIGYADLSSQITQGVILFSAVSVAVTIFVLFKRPYDSETFKLEIYSSLGLIFFSLLFFFFPMANSVYPVLFNLILLGLIFAMLFIGYNSEQMGLVNSGLFWFAVLIVARYFDFFWKLLPRSLFFIIGGLVLIIGGIVLEKKRRELKTKFGAK
ncbi:MAG: DUF2157 domain-containing protein [archaeon]